MTVQTLILVGLFPVAAVLLLIEYRIMRKPRAQRTVRQQKFLEADVRASAAYRKSTLRVLPVIVIVFACLMLVLSVPYWLSPPHRVVGFVLTAAAVVFGVAGAVAARFFLSAKGREWIDRTNSRFANAAENSQPHWFINFKAGLAIGIVFAALGLALLTLQILNPTSVIGFVLPSIIFLVGLAALVAGVAQRHTEQGR
ncbi:MAG TPA: hypothetical protein VGM94_10705 [Galbitalea sp.]